MRILPGQYFDQETGLYYNGARYYDPKIGRYISSDPMTVAEYLQLWRATLGTLNQPPLELNSYGYAYQNPLRYTDPTGLLGADTIIEWLLQQAAQHVVTGAAEKIAGDPLKRGVAPERQALENRDEQQYWQCVKNCRNNSCLNKEDPSTWQSTWENKQSCEASCQKQWEKDTAAEKAYYP